MYPLYRMFRALSFHHNTKKRKEKPNIKISLFLLFGNQTRPSLLLSQHFLSISLSKTDHHSHQIEREKKKPRLFFLFLFFYFKFLSSIIKIYQFFWLERETETQKQEKKTKIKIRSIFLRERIEKIRKAWVKLFASSSIPFSVTQR